MSEEAIAGIELEVAKTLEEAVEFARDSGEPDLVRFLEEVEACA